jgi:hypothetical protein
MPASWNQSMPSLGAGMPRFWLAIPNRAISSCASKSAGGVPWTREWLTACHTYVTPPIEKWRALQDSIMLAPSGTRGAA